MKRERTCIACGAKAEKGRLHRIVRDSDGSARFDPTGKAAGRGAYVCSIECLEKASRGKLQGALRCPVGADEAATIARDLEEALSGAAAR